MCGAIELTQPDYKRISLYRSEPRAETQISTASLSKLLEWKKTRENNRRKYIELLNSKIIGPLKNREKPRFGTQSLEKDKILGVSALIPKKYKLPSPSINAYKRNNAKLANESAL